MSEHGLVTRVGWAPQGTHLTADAAVSATELDVEWVGEFPNSGTLELNGDLLEYDSVDEDASTITLSSPLAEAGTENDQVNVVAGGQTLLDYVLWVNLGDGDEVEVSIPFGDRDLWPEGDYDDPVPIVLSDDLERIEDVPGRTPVRNAAFIDPGTLPSVPSDGDPPDSSPTPTVQGGIGALVVRVPAVDNPDLTTVDIFVSATSPVSVAGTPAASVPGGGPGLTFIRQVGGVDVVAGTTYYVATVARDVDGSAAASAEASGTPAQVNSGDIAVGALTADLLIANDAFIEALQTTDFSSITITGATLQTEAADRRGVKIDTAEGLKVYDSAGNPFLLANPTTGMAIVAGEGKFQTITVTEGTSLGGVTEIPTGSRMVLNSGTTAPKSAPTLDYGHDTVQFDDDGKWSIRVGLATDGTHWYTTRFASGNPSIEKWDSSGSLVDSTSETMFGGVSTLGGAVYDETDVYLVFKWSGAWFLWQYDIATLLPTGGFYTWEDEDGTRLPAFGFDPSISRFLVAQSRASNSDKVRIRRYTAPAGTGDPLVVSSTINTDTGLAHNLSGIAWSDDAGFGGDRYVISNQGTLFFRSVNDSTGAFVPGEHFPSSMTAKVGFVYHDGAFHSIDRTGLMRTYTGITTTVENDPNMTKWVSNTLVRDNVGTDYETDQSPRASIVLPKRSKLMVNTSAIPTGGAEPPTAVDVYVGQGATDPGRTNMHLQTSGVTGQTSYDYDALTTGGGNPPAANNFPGGDGSSFESTATDGSDPLTDIRDDGYFRAAKFIQSGSITVSVTANQTATDSITFPVEFDTVPTVTFATNQRRWVVNTTGDPTTTGVGIRVQQTSDTSETVNVKVYWIATTAT